MIVNFNDIRYGRNKHVYPVRFKNGEETFRADDYYKGKHIVLVCNYETMDKDDFYSLLQVIDCMSKFSTVFVFMPYFFGQRQHRDSQAEHSTLDCFLNQKLIIQVGAEGIYTIDLHSPIGMDYVKNLSPYSDVAKHITSHSIKCDAVIAPDHGAQARAKVLADYLGVPVANYKKIRNGSEVNVQFEKNLDLTGLNCIVVDDIIDTGSTLLKVVEDARKRGAQIKYVYATHCLMTEDADLKFENADIRTIGVTGSPDDYVYANDREFYLEYIAKWIDKEVAIDD